MSSEKRIAARYGLTKAEVNARRFRRDAPPLTFLRAARLLYVERTHWRRRLREFETTWHPRIALAQNAHREAVELERLLSTFTPTERAAILSCL